MSKTWSDNRVRRNHRLRLNRHESLLIWFTSPLMAEVTELAYGLERELFSRDFRTYVLCSDNVRHGLCADLADSADDCRRSVIRVAEAGRLFVDAGLVTIVAVHSPARAAREFARRLFRPGEFLEIYVKAEAQGIVPEDYEKPANAELGLDLSIKDLPGCLEDILCYLKKELIL